MADPGFWNAQERAREVVQEVKTLKNWVDPFDKLMGRIGRLFLTGRSNHYIEFSGKF